MVAHLSNCILVDDPSLQTNHDAYLLVDVHTLVFTLQNATGPRKSRACFIDAATGKERTYGQVVQDIDGLVQGLYGKLGFEKWDVVGIFSPNHIESVPNRIHYCWLYYKAS
jgi:acyl-coenzyme A synthetase/AMP-(fatty) acid ligase